jgi:hypothetical protein
MPITSLALWKDFFLTNKQLDLSNNYLGRISSVVGPKVNIEVAFDEISKNHGVSLLFLDPSESKLQLFHHPNLFGDSWSSSEQQLVAVLGIDASATPIKIISKSVKDVKLKSHSLEAISEVIDDPASLAALTSPKSTLECDPRSKPTDENFYQPSRQKSPKCCIGIFYGDVSF